MLAFDSLWASGFSEVQKKNIVALHNAAHRHGSARLFNRIC